MLSNSLFIRKELGERRELLYQIAYSWCHQPALADDLVQETMVKAPAQCQAVAQHKGRQVVADPHPGELLV